MSYDNPDKIQGIKLIKILLLMTNMSTKQYQRQYLNNNSI